jgi:hypothetical protein
MPGRDCPGWSEGGICNRIGGVIDDNPEGTDTTADEYACDGHDSAHYGY